LVWQPEGYPACKKLSGGMHMAQQMPLSLSLAPINPDWFHLPAFTFLVPAHPGSPEENPRGL